MSTHIILVIDDSEALIAHVERVLSARNPEYRLLSSRNGLDGFKVLLANRVDLVLCDLMMPGIDGFKLLSLKRSRPELRDVPVIMLTGASDVGAKVKGLEAGAADYLTKPFHDEELVARVRVHLKLKALQEELREKNARLEELANTDGLTQLTNRRRFMEIAEIEMARAKRHGSALALVLLDIDHFKTVNDCFGHHMGDQALVMVGRVLRRDLRREDIAARIGGEEFVVMLPQTNASGARAFAERYRTEVRTATILADRGELQITVSLGVAAYPELPADSLGELLRYADRALYQAKDAGRDRVVLATSAEGAARAGSE
jgi:diguanylate cyclase (GGDEF)-like protein